MKRKIAISLDRELFMKIEERRNKMKRSKFIEWMIREGMLRQGYIR